MRLQRHKKVCTTFLPQGMILKLRLIPWIKTGSGCIWLTSMAVGKSMKQINQWMNRRSTPRVCRLDSSLTGKFGPKTQAIAIRQVRQWLTEIPAGDSICLRCESTLPEKQFRVWKKWFKTHEDIHWEISEEHKAFFFYNKGC